MMADIREKSLLCFYRREKLKSGRGEGDSSPNGDRVENCDVPLFLPNSSALKIELANCPSPIATLFDDCDRIIQKTLFRKCR